MHGAAKICRILQRGVTKGVCNNLEHKYNLVTGLLTSPIDTLRREYVEPLVVAGRFVGKAISRSFDLVRSSGSPEDFERKTRPLITMARNIARGVFQHPEEVIALGVDMLMPSGSAMVKRIQRLASFAKPGQLVSALHDSKQIAQKVATEAKVAQDVAHAVDPVKTVFEEGIKAAYAEQKAVQRVEKTVYATEDAINAFKHNFKYHPRIRARALQDPVAHNFPYSFDDIILQVKPTKQADGSLLFRKIGTLNNTDGVFELALNPETKTIFHRTFTRGK